MALTLTSSSFTEGATLGMDHILSADYGFGCGGGNKKNQAKASETKTIRAYKQSSANPPKPARAMLANTASKPMAQMR